MATMILLRLLVDSDESQYLNQTRATSSPAGLNHLAEGKCLTSRTFWQTIKSRKSRSRSRTGAYSHAQLSGSMTEAANGSSHVAAAPDGCACSAAPAASGCAAGHGFDGNEAGTCAGPDAGWVQVQLKDQVHGKVMDPTMLTVRRQACTGLRASMPQLSLQMPAAAAALLLTAARQDVPAVMAGLMPVSCRCWLWP